jgi:DNA-binding response OmpR family regulator
MVSGERLTNQSLRDEAPAAGSLGAVGLPANDLATTARTALKVLVIDDDPRIRELVAFSLARQGFSVSTAESGRVGLKMFASQQPALVITDILMPDMEGIETILALKAGATPPRVIAISGGGRLAGRDFLKWATQLGADEILPKPFRMSALVAMVCSLLGETPAEGAACLPSEPAPLTTHPCARLQAAAPQPDRGRRQCAYC